MGKLAVIPVSGSVTTTVPVYVPTGVLPLIFRVSVSVSTPPAASAAVPFPVDANVAVTIVAMPAGPVPFTTVSVYVEVALTASVAVATVVPAAGWFPNGQASVAFAPVQTVAPVAGRPNH